MSNLNVVLIESTLYNIKSIIYTFLTSTKETLGEEENYILLKNFYDEDLPSFGDKIRENSNLFESSFYTDSLIKDLRRIEKDLDNDLKSFQNISSLLCMNRMLTTTNRFEILSKELFIMHSISLRINEQIEPAVHKALDDVKLKVGKIDAAMLAIEHHETDKIYLGLSQKYQWEYFRNNGYFFITLIIAGYVSWYYSASLEQISNLTNGVLVAFIAFKILLISIAITLITLFLRRSSHAKKLQDQAFQTHVEISAFPIHVRSLKEDDQHSLVKELAMKYFGKELDHSQTDKAGDLMAEQIRISTEMVKASAEMVKSVKSSGASESNNSNS